MLRLFSKRQSNNSLTSRCDPVLHCFDTICDKGLMHCPPNLPTHLVGRWNYLTPRLGGSTDIDILRDDPSKGGVMPSKLALKCHYVDLTKARYECIGSACQVLPIFMQTSRSGHCIPLVSPCTSVTGRLTLLEVIQSIYCNNTSLAIDDRSPSHYRSMGSTIMVVIIRSLHLYQFHYYTGTTKISARAASWLQLVPWFLLPGPPNIPSDADQVSFSSPGSHTAVTLVCHNIS